MSSANFEAVFGGGSTRSALPLWHKAFPTSQVFTAPFSGWYRIYGFGAGGAGAASICNVGSPSHASRATVTGGAGGGYLEKSVFLNAGDQLTIVIGAGGSNVDSGTAPIETLSGISIRIGADGGMTSITSPSLDLQIPGGRGGGAATTEQSSSNWVVAGRGQTPIGGDINRAGGDGGIIEQLHTSLEESEIFGGGACAVIDTLLASVSHLPSTSRVFSTFNKRWPAASVNGLTSGADYIAAPVVPFSIAGRAPGEPGYASDTVFGTGSNVVALKGGVFAGGGAAAIEESFRYAYGGDGGIAGGGGASSSTRLGRGGLGGDGYVVIMGVAS